MKKIAFLTLLFLSTFSFAQPYTSNSNPNFDTNVFKIFSSIFTIQDNARVLFQSANDINTDFTRGLISNNMFFDKSNGNWKHSSTSNFNDFAFMRFENSGKISFFGRQGNGNGVEVLTDAQMESFRLMTINPSGQVGIGSRFVSQNNNDSKLLVNGKILCEEVEVIQDVLPDYVFQKYYTGTSELKADYIMPTLEEVEAYTKENYHLPEVPSAAEIKEDGMQLKEMTTILLQKIEELTLYTIEQEKRIKALEAQLTEEE